MNINEKILELAKLNNVSLSCSAFEVDGTISWMASQVVVADNQWLGRHGTGKEPELAIAACKTAEWESCAWQPKLEAQP